jgi:hypothetical protein
MIWESFEHNFSFDKDISFHIISKVLTTRQLTDFLGYPWWSRKVASCRRQLFSSMLINRADADNAEWLRLKVRVYNCWITWWVLSFSPLTPLAGLICLITRFHIVNTRARKLYSFVCRSSSYKKETIAITCNVVMKESTWLEKCNVSSTASNMANRLMVYTVTHTVFLMARGRRGSLRVFVSQNDRIEKILIKEPDYYCHT